MATFRERLAAFRGADARIRETDELNERVDKLETSLTLAINAVADPQFTTAQDLLAQLKEFDPDYLDLLVDQLGWETLGGAGPSIDREWQAAVEGSRIAWRSSSPLAQWAIWTWTAWGLGDGVEMTAEDESAQEWLDEFVAADRNAVLLGQDNIHSMSERVLVNGNLFLVFYASTVDGKATVRVISQDQIDGNILTNPEDSLEPWFYKRTYTTGGAIGQELYYPDWTLLFGGDEESITVDEAWAKLQELNLVSRNAQRADQARNGNQLGDRQEPGTAVCMLHIAHNRKDNDSLWGWPILTVALPWLRAHKRFMQARLTVALAVAQFVRRSKTQGGSRQVASVINQIASNLSRTNYTDTNPPAAAGAWHVENKAVDTEELPMTTGASDAKADNEYLAWITGLGAGLNTTTMGLDTARYATAVQMDKVQSFLFNRYKTFWSTQFSRMARIVLSFAEEYGGGKFSTMDVQVSIDSFGLPDFPDIVESQGRLMAEMTNAVNAGVMPGKAAAAIDARMIETALQALGVSDAAELTNDEAFEIGDFEPEEEPEPEPPPMLPMMQPVPQEQPEEPETEEPEESTGEAEQKGPGRGWWGPEKGGTHGAGSGSSTSASGSRGRGSGSGGGSSQNPREFTSESEAESWLGKTFEGISGKVGPDGMGSITDYTKAGFRAQNAYLRGKWPPSRDPDTLELYEDEIEDINNRTRLMDAAFKSGGITSREPMVVYRGGGRQIADLSVGDKFLDKGFLSTSLLKREGEDFVKSGSVLTRIRIPTGKLMLPGTDYEAEVIFGRDQQFVVVSKTSGELKGKPVTFVELEML